MIRPLGPASDMQKQTRQLASSKATDKEQTKVTPESVSEELQLFSKDITTLLECFSQFPEFRDKNPDPSFSNDLKVGF